MGAIGYKKIKAHFSVAFQGNDLLGILFKDTMLTSVETEVIVFLLILGGFLLGRVTGKKGVIHKKSDEAIDYIPPLKYNERKPFFAEPKTPEEAFKESKSVDDFITKL